MLKLKLVILKYHARLLSITENNKTIYFCDGCPSTREELNKIYKDYKNNFYNFKGCIKDLIVIHDYWRGKKEYIEKLKSAKYPFPHMADDYRREKEEEDYNNRIDNIIEGIKNL